MTDPIILREPTYLYTSYGPDQVRFVFQGKVCTSRADALAYVAELQFERHERIAREAAFTDHYLGR